MTTDARTTSARDRRRAFCAAFVCCVGASTSYLGAVKESAYFGYLPITVLLAAGAVWLPQNDRAMPIVSGLITTVIWATTVNLLSGEFSGPVARSSLICGVGTTIAMTSTRRLWSGGFLLGILVILSGAMYYGAAGEMTLVAVLTTLGSVTVLAALSSVRDNRPLRPRSPVLWLAISFLFILITVGGLALSRLVDSLLNQQSPIVSPLVTVEEVLPSGRETPPSLDTVRPVAIQDVSQNTVNGLSRLTLAWWIVLTLILLGLGSIFFRAMYVSLRLRFWQRRLMRLEGADKVTATWGWTIYHLRRLRWPLPLRVSPDSFLGETISIGWPAELGEPMERLSRLAVDVTYAGVTATPDLATRAWEAADEIVSIARRRSTRPRRLYSRFARLTG
jgi:hypothetical protein